MWRGIHLDFSHELHFRFDRLQLLTLLSFRVQRLDSS
jgi:hypothetical protein